MTRQLRRCVRKYTGGGLSDLGDTGIPKAQVEVYLRSAEGETFYVPTLSEGILHLLSTEGNRLGISYWPDGAGFHKPEYKITIWRSSNELSCDVIAPMLESWKPSSETGRLNWKLDYQDRLPASGGSVEVVDLATVLGLVENSKSAKTETEDPEEFVDRIEESLDNPAAGQSPVDSYLFEEVEVVIDGTQI